MQIHRVLNPHWRFNDPAAFLLAEIAGIESWRRYLEVLPRFEDTPEKVPVMFRPVRYGPPTDAAAATSAHDDVAAAAEARATADQIRAEL